jgi:hypothetical protein
MHTGEKKGTAHVVIGFGFIWFYKLSLNKIIQKAIHITIL